MGEEDDEPTTLEEAAKGELACLWGDLDEAVRRAINRDWSIQCENLAARIKTLTRFVGPTPWEEIQISLLESGRYQRLHAEMGVAVEVDMARVAETRRRINARMADFRARYLAPPPPAEPEP